MLIDLNADVTWQSVRGLLRAFLSWWARELVSAVPLRWRAALDARNKMPVLCKSAGGWEVFSALDDGGASIFPDIPSAADVSVMVGKERGWDGSAIIFCLSKEDYLRRAMTFPAASTAALRKAVALQIDRISPFRTEDVAFAIRRLDGGDGVARATHDVVIIPRAKLEMYQTLCAKRGLRIAAFHFAPDVSLPVSGRAQPRARIRFAVAAVATALLIAVVGLAPLMRQSELADLTGTVATLRHQIADARQLRIAHRAHRAIAVAYSAQAPASPAIEIIQVLTDGLPDKVSLRKLEIDGAKLSFIAIGANVQEVRHLLAKVAQLRIGHIAQLGKAPATASRVSVTARFAPRIGAGNGH